MFLLNPLLAFGALLAAVPLIIHLLNRRRHQPLPWAAMRFVMAAYKKTRRRAQLENLLLLLLRMAAVALLAFALSRPFTGGAGPLGAFTESRRDVVLVIDGSASTDYRENVKSVHDSILERAEEILGDLDGSRGDRARLIRAASYPVLLSWRTPEEALQILSTIQGPTHEPLDLGAALEEIADQAEEDGGAETGQLEVRLLTDMQRVSFEPASTSGEADTTDLYDQLDRLDALGLKILVEDLGPADTTPPNLAVASVEPLGSLFGPNVPAEIGVEIRNHGPTSRAQVRVALKVDGERRPSAVVDVPARGRSRAVFPVVFASSGQHVLEASIEGDRMAVDDSRVSVVDVPDPIRVLLVNGAPAAEVERDEVGLLSAVLDPPDDVIGGPSLHRPFLTRTVTADGIGPGEIEFADYDVLWLANVRTLSRDAIERLEARVSSGAGLVISVGDEVDPAYYNSLLWRADGSGLLPAELGDKVSLPPREGYFRVSSFDEEHPALRFFADDRWKALLTEVPVQSFLGSLPLPSAQALASLDNETGTPLLIEREFDRGRVVLLSTTIDIAWTRLAKSPRTLVPLVHELLRHLGSRREPPRNTRVGSPLTAETSEFPRGLTLVLPDATRRPLDGAPEELSDGLWRLPTVASADRLGLWRIERDEGPSLLFGVQMDPLESDLDRVVGENAVRHPALEFARSSGASSAASDGGDDTRGELWRILALACLAALIAESLWAAWLGYKRRAA